MTVMIAEDVHIPVVQRWRIAVTAALVGPMALVVANPTAADTIRDRTWLWGHDANSFEGTDLAGRFGPMHVDIPQACGLLGVTNACVVRWKGLPEEPFEDYCRRLSGLKAFGWSAADGDMTQSFLQKSDRVIALARQFPKLSTVWLDGWFEEQSIRRPVCELVELRRRLADLPQRPKLTVVFQSHEFDQDPKPVIDACDQVSFWFWRPADILRAEELFSRCRILTGPDKPILVAITLWDMPGGCEIGDELMARQLDFAERSLRSGEAAGLVIHCSPLVDCNLSSVRMMKEWMLHKGDVVLPPGPCHCADTGVCRLPAGECNSIGSLVNTRLGGKIAKRHRVVREDAWYGGRRTVFDFDGYEAWVVEPSEGVGIPPEKPWTWTMQWRTAFVPRTGVPKLLKAGYHHVSVNTFDRRMDEEGLRVSAAFQRYLVEELGFSRKANLIGLSWGGFFSIRYAAKFPQNVEKIYLDCPLLNLGGWCKGIDGAREIGKWAEEHPTPCWTDDPRMPINLVRPLAEAGIPVLLSYGGADDIVDPCLNSALFARRFERAGGKIEVFCRENYGHHPHGFEESDPTVVEFFAGKCEREQ